jgi:hypothetical protein
MFFQPLEDTILVEHVCTVLGYHQNITLFVATQTDWTDVVTPCAVIVIGVLRRDSGKGFVPLKRDRIY